MNYEIIISPKTSKHPQPKHGMQIWNQHDMILVFELCVTHLSLLWHQINWVLSFEPPTKNNFALLKRNFTVKFIVSNWNYLLTLELIALNLMSQKAKFNLAPNESRIKNRLKCISEHPYTLHIGWIMLRREYDVSKIQFSPILTRLGARLNLVFWYP